MDGESLAAPRAVGFAAATEREQRIPALRQGNGGIVREKLDRPEEMRTIQNLFQGNGKVNFLQILCCGILLTLGILSAVMGVFAEYYSFKEMEVIKGGRSCGYPGDLVMNFCTHAATFLIAAQVLAIVFGCFVCYSGKGRPNVSERLARNSPAAHSGESLATTYLLASWVFCLLALYYFAAADITRGRNKLGTTCTVVKSFAFIKGSAFALATVGSGLIFYLAKCLARLRADAKLESSEDQSLV